VVTDYEQLAARYDEDRAKFSFTRDVVLDELIAANTQVRVVDVGCGTGPWLAGEQEVLGGSPVTLIGADPSPAMLAEARCKALEHLVLARAESLPFADGSVTYLVSSYCFHHFTDKERALDEVARVVEDEGGVFRLSNIEPAVDGDDGWLATFFPGTVAIDAARFWPTERIVAALEARGFVVAVERESERAEIPALDALADAERRVVSQLAVLDDAAYEHGLSRLRDLASLPGATVMATMARVSVIARQA